MRAGHRGIFDDGHRRFVGSEHDVAVGAGLGQIRRIRLAGIGFGELRRRNGSDGAGKRPRISVGATATPALLPAVSDQARRCAPGDIQGFGIPPPVC